MSQRCEFTEGAGREPKENAPIIKTKKCRMAYRVWRFDTEDTSTRHGVQKIGAALALDRRGKARQE